MSDFIIFLCIFLSSVLTVLQSFWDRVFEVKLDAFKKGAGSEHTDPPFKLNR